MISFNILNIECDYTIVQKFDTANKTVNMYIYHKKKIHYIYFFKII